MNKFQKSQTARTGPKISRRNRGSQRRLQIAIGFFATRNGTSIQLRGCVDGHYGTIFIKDRNPFTSRQFDVIGFDTQ